MACEISLLCIFMQKQKRSTYRKPVQKQEREEKERVKPHTSSSKTAKQLLGEIYRDREFLDRLYNGMTFLLHFLDD